MIDPQFYNLVKHLHRGGRGGYYWTPDGTDEHGKNAKLTYWFDVPGKTPDPPASWLALNVYYGVHPCTRNKHNIRRRAENEDVAAVNCFFAEYDAATPADKKDLIAHIHSLPVVPSVIVDSGGGFHCYWLLLEPFVLAHTADRERAAALQYAWAEWAGADVADTTVKDLARVLRVPGTFNHKPEFAPNFPEVRFVEFSLDQLYTIEELETIAAEIAERQAARNPVTNVPPPKPTGATLADQELLDKARHSKTGVLFGRLWDGDASDYHNDHSRADQALCNMLAFWTQGDSARIDSLFRQSGLMRPKWERKDYREDTIHKAINSVKSHYLAIDQAAIDAAAAAVGMSKPKPTPKPQPAPAASAHTPPPAVDTFTAPPRPSTQDYLNGFSHLNLAFRMCDLDDQIEVQTGGKWAQLTDGIASGVRSQMRDLGFRDMRALTDVLMYEAHLHRFHPVRDYLNSLDGTWDGEDHIAVLAGHVADAHPIIRYSDGGERTVFHAWLRRFLVGAVAKAQEGAQNPMLVIDGAQGIGKSWFVRWLGSSLPALRVEKAIQPDTVDDQRLLASRWIWEVAELGATTRKADRESLKHFISLSDVTFRLPYAVYQVTKKALASFAGTINNEAGFLSDPTGWRRFNVVKVLQFDHSYTSMNIDQIWAQAAHLYLHEGEPLELLPEERERRDEINSTYETEDALEAFILRNFEIDPARSDWFAASDEIVTTLRDAGVREGDRSIHMSISTVLVAQGLAKTRKGHGGIRGWVGIRKRNIAPGIPYNMVSP